MIPTRLPLERFPLVATRSIEQAMALQSTINSPVRGELTKPRAKFEWQANRVVVGGLGIVASSYRAAVHGRMENIDQQYSLIVPRSEVGGSAEQRGQRGELAANETAALLSPG